MVASDAVAAVHDGVDKPLAPRVFGHQPDGFEAAGGPQRAPGWLEVSDGLLSQPEHLGNRTFAPDILRQLLPGPRPALQPAVTQHAYEGCREVLLRLLSEEQQASDRQLAALFGETASR